MLTLPLIPSHFEFFGNVFIFVSCVTANIFKTINVFSSFVIYLLQFLEKLSFTFSDLNWI
jgi:hypothetical protein